MTLEILEKLARKNGTAAATVAGEVFEVARQIKSVRHRFSYRHGARHMGRDEAENIFTKFAKSAK